MFTETDRAVIRRLTEYYRDVNTVRAELKDAVEWVKDETGEDITDFLYDVANDNKYNDDGEVADVEWITRKIWGEAENYVDFQKGNY